ESIPIGDYFERFEAAGYALWFYVAKDLVPVHLSVIYPRWDYSQLTIWPSMVALAAAAVFWWFRAGWGRTALFAGGCYVAMLLPILGFIKMSFMRLALVADHFQYSALPVAMALVAALCVWAVQNDRARMMVAGGVAIFLGALTWQQAGFYRDDETLWTETLRLNPDSWAAHDNLGKALAERKDLKDAIPHFSEAVRLKPDDSNLHCMLGTALMQTGDFDRAVLEFAEAIKRNPQDYRPHTNLALVLNEMGQFKPALEHGKAAVALAPNAAEPHDRLGISLAALGETDRAIVQFQAAIRLDPRDATAHLGWAITLMHLDRPAEAAEQARAALAIDPDFPEAHFNLGNAYAAQSKREDAAREYREAIRLRPEFPEAWANLRDVTSGRPE
ncbi:MAG TPA: tetratricopeptide repeat protein, partial [Pirellulales bacterium]|nr:tetratricopeptide repeat protein [Pirellulales bacterium]